MNMPIDFITKWNRYLSLSIFYITAACPVLIAGEPPTNGAVEAISTAERVDREIFFESKIRPMLTQKCLSCHGPVKKEAFLSLNSRHDLVTGRGTNKPAVAIPGNSKKSLVIQILAESKSGQAIKNHSISKEELQDLKRWIDDGAIWPENTPHLISTEK